MNEIITSADALQRVVRRVREAGKVGVDTEFLWERTYYARLGIVQLALDEDTCWIVDAVAVRDLSPLGRVLSDESTTKFLHDAQQDLTILRRATGGYPRNIFDTRLACGFAGLKASLSLESALREMLHVSLPKTETRANWVRRPLSTRQIHYAFDDVRYLPALREKLMRRVAERGLEGWLMSEMATLDDRGLYEERVPDEQYLRVRGRGHLSGMATAVLKSLAAWREREAARRDRPRGHIVPDAGLVSMARERPSSFQALRECDGVSQGAARRYGEALLRLIQEGSASSLPGEARENTTRRKGGIRALSAELIDAVRFRAEKAGVDPGAVSSRAEVTALLTCSDRHERSRHRLLQGWRRELIGPELQTRLENGP